MAWLIISLLLILPIFSDPANFTCDCRLRRHCDQAPGHLENDHAQARVSNSLLLHTSHHHLFQLTLNTCITSMVTLLNHNLRHLCPYCICPPTHHCILQYQIRIRPDRLINLQQAIYKIPCTHYPQLSSITIPWLLSHKYWSATPTANVYESLILQPNARLLISSPL